MTLKAVCFALMLGGIVGCGQKESELNSSVPSSPTIPSTTAPVVVPPTESAPTTPITVQATKPVTPTVTKKAVTVKKKTAAVATATAEKDAQIEGLKNGLLGVCLIQVVDAKIDYDVELGQIRDFPTTLPQAVEQLGRDEFLNRVVMYGVCDPTDFMEAHKDDLKN